MNFRTRVVARSRSTARSGINPKYQKSMETLSKNRLQQIRHFAEALIVLFPRYTQRRRAENLRVVGGGKFPIVDNNQLIKRQVRHPVQLRHEQRMDANHKPVFRLVTVWLGPGTLPRLQRGGVERDGAGVADTGPVLQKAQQLAPADARPIFFKNLRAAGRDMGAQRFPGVIGCKLFGHGSGCQPSGEAAVAGIGPSGASSFSLDKRPWRMGTDMRRKIV